MGKSDKKAKRDRINNLRKQYDAFLEEDKRRRDRNEFILGRLDKMRLSSAPMVPIQRMEESPICKYYGPIQIRPEYRENTIRFDGRQILLPRKQTQLPEEQVILNEISKKYILIPKLRSTNEHVTYVNPDVASHDTDWKNKYNILDELKKLETGESELSEEVKIIDTNAKLNRNDDQLQCGSNEDLILKEPNNNLQKSIDLTQASDLEIINEHTSDSTLEDDKRNKTEINKLSVEVKQKEISDNMTKSIENLPDLSSINIEHSKFNNLSMKEEDLSLIDNGIVVRNTSYDDKVVNNNLYQDHQLNKRTENNLGTKNNSMDNQQSSEPIVESNALEFDSTPTVTAYVTSNAKLEVSSESNLETAEIIAQPVDTIQNQESCDIVNVPTLDNNNPQQYEHSNEPTNSNEDIITSQIDEFEAEQKEMFYSEETEESQNLQNLDYTTQNQEYTNEQYSYYNETQQEEPYYAQINEHEESTQHYDPNYEQQYVNNYEDVSRALYSNQQYGEEYQNQEEITSENYEQPGNIEYIQPENVGNAEQITTENITTYEGQSGENIVYENQQIENHEMQIGNAEISSNQYDSEQNYEQMQNSELETVQNLENQLDREEGYVDIANDSNTVENVSELKQSDIKVT